ncbi:hypothetical protein D9C73_010159 [Collichthys lucidus]|uniref:Uncharacterized protein n=1 Tax=Collichthys lucidus TaxID=240159 RepID=A0A4U5UMY8_COLLU|nr:hypothetical protein D9C73_010159 [Collichthys lucidus]
MVAWDIVGDKVLLVVTDNGSNIVKAVRLLSEKPRQEIEPSAHSTRLPPGDGLDDVSWEEEEPESESDEENGDISESGDFVHGWSVGDDDEAVGETPPHAGEVTRAGATSPGVPKEGSIEVAGTATGGGQGSSATKNHSSLSLEDSPSSAAGAAGERLLDGSKLPQPPSKLQWSPGKTEIKGLRLRINHPATGASRRTQGGGFWRSDTSQQPVTLRRDRTPATATTMATPPGHNHQEEAEKEEVTCSRTSIYKGVSYHPSSSRSVHWHSAI